MCGFVGFYNNSDSFETSKIQIKKMNKALIRRGPDDESFWISKNKEVYFGFRRLSIVDLSENARQPMSSKNNRYILMFNGEVYNFVELKEKLNLDKTSLKSSSDTEILIECINKFGLEKSLNMIEGMFAICLYDTYKNCIYLARDRFGEKPLYYGNINNTFIFSSQLSAIKQYKDWKKDLDIKSISLFFRYNYVPCPRSIYKNIYKLEPGKILEFDINRDDKIKISTWFSIKNLYFNNYNTFKGTFDDATNIFAAKVDNAVSYHKNLEVNTGIYLSGGLDSSVLATCLSDKHNISTHTIKFKNIDYDESENAFSLSNYIQSDHNEYLVEPDDIKNIIKEMYSIYDEPFADSSQIPTSLISSFARNKIKVAITGDGGDEFFLGYNRYIWANKIYGKFDKLPLTLRKILIFFLSTPMFKEFINFLNLYLLPNKFKFTHTINKIEKIVEILSNTNDFRKIYEGFLLNWKDDILINKQNTFEDIIINKDLDLWDIGKTNEEKMMLLDTINYLNDDILTKVDRATMFHSIEARAPFLNLDLVKFAYSLPNEYKIQNNQGKIILREYLNKRNINNYNNFSKRGFHIPIKEWMRKELKEYFFDFFNMDKVKKNNIIDNKIIQNTFNDHINFTQNNEYKIWSLFIFFQWYENQ